MKILNGRKGSNILVSIVFRSKIENMQRSGDSNMETGHFATRTSPGCEVTDM